MGGAKIVVIEGVRYREEEAIARGIIGEKRGTGALTLTAAQVDVDALVEARVAKHQSDLDAAFEAKVAAAVAEQLDAKVAEAIAAQGDGKQAETPNLAGEQEPVKPANRAAKPATK